MPETPPSTKSRIVKALAAMGLAAAAVAVAVWFWRGDENSHSTKTSSNPPSAPIELVSLRGESLRLDPNTARQLGVTIDEVRRAPSTSRLRLTGSLFIDPSRLVHIHARFPGEVVAIGTLPNAAPPATQDNDTPPSAAPRAIRVGDTVAKGQLLAQLWCREIGEKKSDLVDAVSQLHLDDTLLKRLRKLDGGVVPQRTVEEAERKLEADKIAVSRAERTLRSWRISDDEIDAIYSEADKIRKGDRNEPIKSTDSWAEASIRSPIDGVILEQNVVPGDIVDTTIDLFKVADLSRIGVMANVYEEDLPRLESLPPEKRQWRIQLKAEPDTPSLKGQFELISNLVDTSQHTATVVGWLDNPNGRLRIGQFITATIELPSPADLVVVPERALVAEGAKSYLFVAEENDGLAYIRTRPTKLEKRAGCEEIAAGERVVTSGVVELAGALKVLKVQSPAPSKQASAVME
jgi:cobalt-zinc-cadmium efflux system membrane fusion protein